MILEPLDKAPEQYFGTGDMSPLRQHMSSLSLAFIVFASATHCIASTPPVKSAAQVKAYVLNQTSSVLGHVVTYITPSALRVDLKDNHSYLVARAPDWKVVLYGAEKKCAMEMSLTEYEKHDAQYSYLPAMTTPNQQWPKLKTGLTSYANVEATRWIYPVNPRLKTANNSTPAFGYFLVLPKKEIPMEPTRILAKLFYQAALPGIPLNERVNETGKKQSNSFLDLRGDYSHLTTQQIREQMVPSDFFKYPEGYKKVKKEIDVLTDKSRLEEIEDMTKEMRVGQ